MASTAVGTHGSGPRSPPSTRTPRRAPPPCAGRPRPPPRRSTPRSRRPPRPGARSSARRTTTRRPSRGGAPHAAASGEPGRQERHDHEGHHEDARRDHEDPGREPAEAPRLPCEDRADRAVCHETATTEAPTTSARMLVIEEIPSRMSGRSASFRCEPCTGRGRRSFSRQNPRASPRTTLRSPAPGTPRPPRAPSSRSPRSAHRGRRRVERRDHEPTRRSRAGPDQ